MKCINCHASRIRVVRTVQDTDATIVRCRACDLCDYRWFTVEHVCSAKYQKLDGRSIPVRTPHTSVPCWL